LQILGNNQLDAFFSCIYLFHVSTCFERHSAHRQEIECINTIRSPDDECCDARNT